MLIKNNPFSKDIGSKILFDRTFEMSADQHEQFSLQRYKELFFYFVNCFSSGKVEMLENDLFNDTWIRDYNNSLGCKLFHLAVNCYLYYIGYREEEDCVDLAHKQEARRILVKISNMNKTYFSNLNMINIQEQQLLLFLSEVEQMPKNRIGKTMIMQEVVRDFYIFSLLLSSVFRIVNLREYFDKNEDIYLYSKYISEEKEKKEIFSTFMSLFYPDKLNRLDDLYAILTNILQPIFTTKILKKAEHNFEKYKTQFPEKALRDAYKKQIEQFLKKTFIKFSTNSNNILNIKNINLLSYRYITSYVKKDFSQEALDALLFNIIMQIIKLLEENKVLEKRDFNTNDINGYINLLEGHSCDFVIGAADVVAPQDYNDIKQIKKFNKFHQIKILSWFRYILALNSKVLSINVNNYQIDFSVPTTEEMKDEYEEIEKDIYKKKNSVERYSRQEFLQFINNTYRKITIKANISIGLGSEKVGMLIFPTKPDKDY